MSDMLFWLQQVACENEHFRKFGRNARHTKTKLSKHGGRNTLKSDNGLRVLSCSSKVAFFVDVSARSEFILPSIKESVERVTSNIRAREFNSSGQEDVALWLFQYISVDFQPREIAVHLGLDVLFYMCMCLSNSDAFGKNADACSYSKHLDLSQDVRKCVKSRYTASRWKSAPSDRAAMVMGRGVVANLKRMVTLLESTFEVPKEKLEHFLQSREDIFMDMDRLCSAGSGDSVKSVPWTVSEWPVSRS